jgi:hypothetical protein
VINTIASDASRRGTGPDRRFRPLGDDRPGGPWVSGDSIHPPTRLPRVRYGLPRHSVVTEIGTGQAYSWFAVTSISLVATADSIWGIGAI